MPLYEEQQRNIGTGTYQDLSFLEYAKLFSALQKFILNFFRRKIENVSSGQLPVPYGSDHILGMRRQKFETAIEALNGSVSTTIPSPSRPPPPATPPSPSLPSNVCGLSGKILNQQKNFYCPTQSCEKGFLFSSEVSDSTNQPRKLAKI